MVKGSGQHLLALINDVLDISKIEAGQIEIASVPFELRESIEKVVQTVSPLADKKHLALTTQVSPDVGRITSDRRRVEQVLLNLLSNAVKFTNKGEVVITVEELPLQRSPAPGHTLHFAVRDSGIGINQERMNRLFQSFNQVDASTTRKYGGTGLGLVISKRLVEMMGGSIWVESEEGKGSTFHFTIQVQTVESSLPVHMHPDQLQLSEKRAAEPPRVDGAEPSAVEYDRRMGERLPLHILLAEDNAVNQKLALLMLERLGYYASVAGNGVEVLEALHRQHFDVVLMDVQMPDMDGLEATRRIRAEFPVEVQPRIIAMTANAMKEDRAICLTSGMDDTISKPIQVKRLVASLSKCRPRRSRGTGPLEPVDLQPAAGERGADEPRPSEPGLKADQPPSFDPAAITRLRATLGQQANELLPDLVTHYKADVARLTGEAQQALVAGKPAQVLLAAHTLKSNSATFGMMIVSAIARDLERRARDGNLEGAAELIRRAEVEYLRAKPLLEQAAKERS
jgi:CheY-like chemotaxis protein